LKKNDYLFSLYDRYNKLEITTEAIENKIPFQRSLEKSSAFSYDDLFELAKRRRSVRWYEDRPVPRELIDKALLIANQSPSACNRQPFKYKIFDQPDLVQKIVRLPKGTPGYAHNIKSVAVLIGDLSAYFHERDRHIIYIDASLSAMGFIYGLEAQGLSSCCINWPDIENLEKKMEKILKLKKYERPIMLISIGFPDKTGLVPYSQKKSLYDLRSYNK